MIKDFIKESLEKLDIIEKSQSTLHEALINPAKNPLGTMGRYFGTKELSGLVTKFLEIKRRFINLDLFKDEFERCEYFKVSKLSTLSTIIEGQDLDHIIDSDFLQSNNTLRLWDIDYPEMISLFEEEIKSLRFHLKQANDNWYTKHEYMISDEVFINKNNFSIYKVSNIDYNKGLLTVLKCYKFQINLSIDKLIIDVGNIRNALEDEVFVAEELSKVHPELFL